MQKKKKRFLTVCEKDALTNLDFMARKLARNFSKNFDFDDNYQIAKIAIVEAARTYNINKGAKFSTHAFNVILANLRKQNMVNKRNLRNDNLCILNNEVQSFEHDSLNLKLILDQEIDKLSDKQIHILKLRYLEGYSVEEIAKLMNCSHQNISKINSKALSSLKANLAGQGLF